MRKIALRVLGEVREEPLRIGELAGRLDKSQGWISDVVAELEKKNLVVKNRRVKLADTYEALLLDQLQDSYNLVKVLAGKREDILKDMLVDPKTAGDLELRGFPKSTVYKTLKDLKAAGVIRRSAEGFHITDQTLKSFLKARTVSRDRNVYSVDGEHMLIVKTSEGEEGKPTAFSAFGRYGVEYYPNKGYFYQGDKKLGAENILVHSVLCAEDKKQMSMCGVFYLKNKGHLDMEKLWKLSEKWNCMERLTDLLAFLDRREVKRNELFLPWREFVQIAGDYDLELRRKHPRERLTDCLESAGGLLEEKMDVYLIGGANLILRGLKDSTKDIDVILRDKDDFDRLLEALKKQGYEEKLELERLYEEFEPRSVLERKGSPRWDIFVESVAGYIQLTEDMRVRSEPTVESENLKLHLLAPTDIFLFKAITDREGDLEDIVLLTRLEEIDWEELFREIKEQEYLTGKYLSFPVLDTLDILSEMYDIDVPIRNRLASYCLENALLLTLEEPGTIKDLREELDFPEHQIYNKLRKLEDEGRVRVDRSGKLNEYVTKEFHQ